MTKDPRVYLAHILECIQKIERFTQEGRSHFFQDALVQDAVLRNLEVIGEAAKRLDDTYRATHPQIPWRALAGLRDVLIHQYESVDPERVWAIVEGELPGLREAIAVLLPPLDQLERELAGEDETPEDRGQMNMWLVAQLHEERAKTNRLDEASWKNLKELGYGA